MQTHVCSVNPYQWWWGFRYMLAGKPYPHSSISPMPFWLILEETIIRQVLCNYKPTRDLIEYCNINFGSDIINESCSTSCGRDSACCHVTQTIFLFFRDTHEDSLFFLKRSCRLRDACICRWICKKNIQNTRAPKDGGPPVHTLVWSLHTHTYFTH